MYQTIFPASETNEEVIRILVEQMGFLSGKEVKVERQIVVYTEDVNLMTSLESLADSMKDRKNGKDAPKKFKKMIVPAEKKNVKGPRSWTNDKTKEVLSAVELKRKVARGELGEYEVWINSKGERFVVMNDGDGWSLTKEAQS